MNSNVDPIVIAEAGVNHNGELAHAFKLVEEAALAGADVVKFQSFKAEKLASKFAKKAKYQNVNSLKSESQLQMLKKLELDEMAQKAILDCCKKHGIGFLSSAFDPESLNFLAGELGQKSVKFGSGELTNAPLLFAAAQLNLKIYLSTGMSTLSEVEDALGIIAFGLTEKRSPTSRSSMKEALLDPQVWRVLKQNVTLFHCTSEYPAAPADINLRSMDTMSAAFDLPVGFSDHSEGGAIALAAIARGAVAIEKHFTLNRHMEGPDHMSSMEPKELRQLVQDISAVHIGLGNGIKQPNGSEIENRLVARKVIVAAKQLNRGHVLSADDLEVKRAGAGISPFEFWECQGKKLKRSIEADQPIKLSDLK